ncbi:hypothetical protein L7F22_028675 [Adiantum nelumboides]|nr:hypothetical protein [Adiantum nelumboides]
MIANGPSIATIVEEFDRVYQEKIQNLSARNTREYMDHEEDYEANFAMVLKATESVFVRKGIEIAVIANPDNGFNFFRLCISFPSWGERGCKMTTFRVYEIARAHITSQEWWLGYILEVSRFPIPEHPSNAWVDSEREETGIYPEDWIDDLQGTDAWQDCPWFLDYADGEFPDVEECAYHAHHKKVKGKRKSSSATVNQPKDAHSPSTAKGRPPRTAKGRPSTLKKRPRPVVSESSESLEEQFELLSREDAKDSSTLTLSSSQSHDNLALQDDRGHKAHDGLALHDDRGHSAHDGLALHESQAEFLLDDGALVVACRAEHLFKVINEAYEFQFCHIRTLFLRMPSHTYVMDCNFTDPVATLIVAMFVRDLDGPLPVPFYDRRPATLLLTLMDTRLTPTCFESRFESSWTLDTSGAAFLSDVEKSKFFARWLIETFTTVGDAVLDCLAGCGGMATECERLHRHCISIEKDVVVF